MPFMIQYMRDTSKRIASLEAKLAPKDEEHAAAAGGMGAPGMGGMGMVRPPLIAPTDSLRAFSQKTPLFTLTHPFQRQMMIANEAYVPTLGGMGGVPGVPGFGGGVPGYPGGGMGYGAPPPFGGMPPPPLGGGMPPPPPSY